MTSPPIFMQEDDSEEVTRLFSLKKLPSFFGPESFRTGIKEKYYFKKKSYEVPESKRLAPTSDSIISSVSDITVNGPISYVKLCTVSGVAV